MKKLITLISIVTFIAIPFLGNAQSIVLHVPSSHLTGDTTNTVDASATAVNTGGSAIDVKVKRTIIYLTPGHLSQICWAGLCTSPNISVSPLTDTIAAGDSSANLKGNFTGNVLPDDIIGTDTINYLFYDINNPADTASVTIIYDFTSATGIKELNPAAGSFMNCSQSDVEDATNITYNIADFKNAKLVIRNLTGAVVKELRLNDKQGVLSVSNSGLPTGMYMYLLYNNNEPIANKKVVIWHR